MVQRQRLRRLVLSAALAAAVVATAPAEAAPTATDDAFIAGYATAILEREFRIRRAPLTVRDGVIRLGAASFAGAERGQVVEVLRSIPGVVRVELVPPAVAAPSPTAPATAAAAPPPAPGAAGSGVMTVARREGLKVFPPASLFDPLHADPRWPHFSVRFEHLNGSPELQDAAAVSFGERLPLLEGDAPFDGRWQVGISGAAYALFDKGSKSEDLINTDYRWFIPLSYRSGPFSALFRYYHQSSHLGDELILRGKPITRVNLSYEAVDLTLSQDIGKRYRVYGGLGEIVRAEPDLEPLSAQLGAEYSGGHAYFGMFRPVAALDLQAREYNGWDPELSVNAGFQVESPYTVGRALRIVAEYYHGKSPNGQFFHENIEYYGFGAHFYF